MAIELDDIEEPYGVPCTECDSPFVTVCAGIAAICWECQDCGHYEIIVSTPVPIEED